MCIRDRYTPFANTRGTVVFFNITIPANTREMIMFGEFPQLCAIGVGICMPLALDAIGVETVAIGVET